MMLLITGGSGVAGGVTGSGGGGWFLTGQVKNKSLGWGSELYFPKKGELSLVSLETSVQTFIYS